MNVQKLSVGLVVVAVSLCVALILCEVMLRYALPQSLGIWRQTRDGLVLLIPSLDGSSKKFMTRIHTNALGFRDVEHDLENSKGSYRVLLLGDSFMEALQVEFEESFPHLLEVELNKQLPCHVEVINAGVSGWGTDDAVTYLLRKGMALHPNLVLFGTTLYNDISDNLEERYHVREGEILRPKPAIETSLFRHASLEVRSYLMSHSHLYFLAYSSWKASWRAKAHNQLEAHVVELMKKFSGVEIEKGWWITKKLFEEANQLTRLAGAKMAVFAIPLVYQVDTQAYGELLEKYHVPLGDSDPNKAQTMLFKILEEENIVSIDVLRDFLDHMREAGATDLYIRGDGHWSQSGHRVAAAAVSRHVAKFIYKTEASDVACGK